MPHGLTSQAPRPRLVFRLGVVGRRFTHHAIRVTPQLENWVREILQCVRSSVDAAAKECAGVYATQPSMLRVVSTLSEGAGQYVARLALEAGFELQCPLPFPQTAYRAHLSEAKPETTAAAEFDRLLRLAGSDGRRPVIQELDGDPLDPGSAHRAAGRVVAAQSDLLVALWDGGPDELDCGTFYALRYALLHRIPVLWVDLGEPQHWRLLKDPRELPESPPPGGIPRTVGTSRLSDVVEQIVRSVLVPPARPTGHDSGHGKVPETALSDYLGERRRVWNLAFPWKIFRDLFSCETPEKLSDLRIQSLYAASPDQKRPDELDWLRAEEWRDAPPDGQPPKELDPATDLLHPHFGWADRLAVFYADHYRSSSVGIYILGTLAVGVVLVCLLMGWWAGHEFHLQETICTVFEVSLIGGIVWLIRCGRESQWHARWMDYRLLAERIRELRFLAGTGGARPLMRHPAFAGHLAGYGDPDATWMAWWVRSLERELGLIPVTINPAYLRQILRHTRVALVAGQARYHESTHHRMGRIDRRLHRLGHRLFGLTLMVCAAHLLTLWVGLPLPPTLVKVILGIGAAFPLIGGALTALRDQGEFQRVAARSEAMHQRMEEFGRELDELERQLDSGKPDSRAVFGLVQDITQAMVHENLGWRVILQDRPLREPG